MKKLIILLLCLLIIPVNVYASTETYIRNESNNYGVTKDIYISDDNLSIIKKTPYVNTKEKVYDFADLFDEAEEAKLSELVSQFISSYSMDFAVITIRENPYSKEVDYTYNKDEYSRNFADDFYDYNDFGIGSDYSGIVFLIDMSNRFLWISSTGSAEYYFNYSNVYDLLDYSASNFSGGAYYEGMVDTIYIMSEEFDKSLEEISGIKYFSSKDRRKLQANVMVSLFVGIITSFIFCSVNVANCRKAKKERDASNYTNVNGVNVVNDILVHTSHTSHVISTGGSGGVGGGHISSSGFHHSGGGHHF